MGVAGCGLDFEDAVVDGQQRDIEGTASQVEDQDVLLTLALFIQAVGDGCSCWFVDDSQDVEAGDESGILGGLSLRVVEVSWHCDDCIFNWLAQIGFADVSHLGEDH